MSQPQCYRFSFRVTSNKTTPVKPLFTAETQRDVDSVTLGNKGDIRRSLEQRSESGKIERTIGTIRRVVSKDTFSPRQREIV